jgi:hypothetical protein
MRASRIDPQLGGVVIVEMFIDKPRGPYGMLGGRRGLQTIGYVVASIAVMLTGVYMHDLSHMSLIALTSIARTFSTTANATTWIAAAELYPPRARAFGTAAAFLINLIGCAPAAVRVHPRRPVCV